MAIPVALTRCPRSRGRRHAGKRPRPPREVPVEGNARVLVAQKPTKGAFANLNGLPAKVRAVELERIESAERHSIVLAAIPEQVEDRRAAHACAYPDRGLACHSGVASRADRTSGRAHNPTHPRQRVCGAGNQSGCAASTSADRTRPKRSGNLLKTHYCCSRSSTAFGPRTLSRSTATLCASLRCSSWRSPKNKGPQSH